MARARTAAGELARMLGACQQPIYLLDSRRIVLFANQACGDWLGIAPEELIGQRCDYHSSTESEPAATLASALCPSPELLTQPHATGMLSIVAHDRREQRYARFQMLQLPDDGETVTLAIVDGEEASPKADSLPPTNQSTPAELHVLVRWLRQSLGARGALDRWVGEHPAVRCVRDQFHAAAQSNARVLLIGAPGSGREALARAIHYRTQSATMGPLIPIDCPLMDAESLQASITSIARQKAASTEHPAALLLLHVDKLTESAQQELLGFLQLPGFALRTLATASHSLVELSQQGTFRADLAYALSTLVIELPALVERRADLPLLVQALVEEFNAVGGKQLSGCTTEALDRLALYAWPGDMQQLAEAVQEACARAAGSQVTTNDLPAWLRQAEQAVAHPRRSDERIILDEFLADVERELIARALQRSRGNKAKAAKLLGISRPRLLRRIEQLGLAVG